MRSVGGTGRLPVGHVYVTRIATAGRANVTDPRLRVTITRRRADSK